MEQGNQEQSAPVYPEAGALTSSEKGTKKSGKLLTIILILVALAGVGFGVYGMLLKPEPTAPACPACVAGNPEEPKKPTEQEEQPTQETPTPTEQQTSPLEPSSILSFRRSFNNVVNSKHKNYYLKYTSTSDMKIHYYSFEEKKDDYYYITCNSESCKIFKENWEEYTTIDNFQSKIRDYYYISFGQGYGDEQIFFVMEDGSVEHIPVHKAFSEKNIKSYGKIEGLNNIIKIHQVGSSSYNYDGNQQVGSGANALAEDIDGNYYDLNEILYPSE